MDKIISLMICHLKEAIWLELVEMVKNLMICHLKVVIWLKEVMSNRLMICHLKVVIWLKEVMSNRLMICHKVILKQSKKKTNQIMVANGKEEIMMMQEVQWILIQNKILIINLIIQNSRRKNEHIHIFLLIYFI